MHVWSCIEAPRSHAACSLHAWPSLGHPACRSATAQLAGNAHASPWATTTIMARKECTRPRPMQSSSHRACMHSGAGMYVWPPHSNMHFCIHAVAHALEPILHDIQLRSCPCIDHALCVLDTDLKRRFCQIFPSVPRAAAATSAAIATRATVVFIVMGVPKLLCSAARHRVMDVHALVLIYRARKQRQVQAVSLQPARPTQKMSHPPAKDSAATVRCARDGCGKDGSSHCGGCKQVSSFVFQVIAHRLHQSIDHPSSCTQHLNTS